jgi:hypothetical protein
MREGGRRPNRETGCGVSNEIFKTLDVRLMVHRFAQVAASQKLVSEVLRAK